MPFKKEFLVLAVVLISLLGCVNTVRDLDHLSRDLDELTHYFYQKGLYQKAFKSSKKSVIIKKAILGQKNLGTIIGQNNMAELQKKLGHFSEALALLEENYALSQKYFGKQHQNTVQTLNDLAIIYQNQGRLEEALSLSQQSHQSIKKILGSNHPDVLQSLQTIASIYRDLSQFSEALYFSKQNLEKRKEVLGAENTNTLDGLENLAILYMSLGKLSEALRLSEQVYFSREKQLGKQHPKTIQSFGHLAKVYQALGRQKEILTWVKDVHNLLLKVLGKKHPDTLNGLAHLAKIYQELGLLKEALPLFKISYELFEETLGKQHPYTIQSQTNLALIYKDLGQLEKSLPLLKAIYAHLKVREKNVKTIKARHHLAEVYLGLGDLSKALPLFKTSYQHFKEVLGDRHPDTLLTMASLASVYAKKGNINKAIKHFQEYVDNAEELRQSHLSAENRQFLFQKWVPDYFTLASLYMNQARPEKAFSIAEKTKARTLLQSMAAKLAAEQSGLTKDEQAQLQKYEETLAILNNRIAKAQNRLNEKLTLERDKNQVVKKLNEFHQKLMAKYPKYAQLSNVQIIGAKEGSKFLPKNAVLISYLVEGNHILAFTLQANGKLTTHDLGEFPNLEKDLDTYRRGLAPVQDSRGNQIIRFKPPERKQETQALGKKLGKRLLEPLKNIIKGKQHWIISPSGALALIPFETLRLDGELVIAQHQISYVQSLSILAMLQKREKAYKRIKNRESLFAMGAPIYSGKKWQDLPGTLKELSALKQIFKGAPIYKQQDATEAKLQSLNKQGILEKYHYLVFSAHGYLSQEVPALSALVLGQVNNPKGIDGYVTAGEWPGYDLKSDLMVLSACETGLGEVIGGEGVMGLPYAFYVAGNKNTILTLWSISDKVTAEFMTSFFKKLKAGRGQIEALTATKREFIKRGGDYSNPMYWAAFVLYGV
jgi:CHAT domain-containing protein